MSWERTFILIKPDAVKRGITGEILSRYERAGLKIVAVKMVNCTEEMAGEHYAEHKGKSFFPGLVEFLTMGPSLAIAAEGARVVDVVRKLNGDTEPRRSAPGTIRGDFSHMGYERCAELSGTIYNVIHASDSVESAQRELEIWFNPEDFCNEYDTVLNGLV